MYSNMEFIPTILNGAPAHHFLTSMIMYNAAKTQKPQPAINVTKLRDQRFLLTGIAPPHCLNSHRKPAMSSRPTRRQLGGQKVQVWTYVPTARNELNGSGHPCNGWESCRLEGQEIQSKWNWLNPTTPQDRMRSPLCGWNRTSVQLEKLQTRWAHGKCAPRRRTLNLSIVPPHRCNCSTWSSRAIRQVQCIRLGSLLKGQRRIMLW